MGEVLTLYIANRICKGFLLIHKKKRQPKKWGKCKIIWEDLQMASEHGK